jgi:O-antigen ligase
MSANTSAIPEVGDPLRTTSFARRWAPRMMLLSLFSYPAIALITSVADMDSRVAAVPLRIVVFFIALYVIAGTSRDGRWLRKNYWVLAFALLYLARLLYDWLVAGIPKADEALTFYVVACLVPCIASGMAGIVALGEKRAAWQLALVGGAICAFAVLMSLLGLGAARTYDPWATGGRLSFEALNPITLGHIGASTLIALLSITRTRMPAANFLVLVSLAAVAVWTMLASGSRGPILSLACAGLVYAAMTARFGWILLIVVALGSLLLFGENAALARFEGTATDDSALIRLAIQGNAIIQFLGSPILGSAYTELQSLEYPHNLIIETAMAMGVVGLLLLIIVLVRTARIAWRCLKEGRTLIPLLFVQAFIGSQFSGSIWGATGLFLTIMVLGSYPRPRVLPATG